MRLIRRDPEPPRLTVVSPDARAGDLPHVRPGAESPVGVWFGFFIGWMEDARQGMNERQFLTLCDQIAIRCQRELGE